MNLRRSLREWYCCLRPNIRLCALLWREGGRGEWCDMCCQDSHTHCCRLCLLLCLSFLLPVGRSAILLAASRILCSISSSLSRSLRELSEDSMLPAIMLPVLLVLRVGEGGTRRGDWGAGR